MRKRKILLLLALLIGLTAGAARGEAPGEEITGYFPDQAFVRPSMESTLEYVDVINGLHVVTLKKVDETWAEYTGEKGITGYVKTASFLPVPEYEPEEPWDVYPENRTEVRSLPDYNAERIYTAAAGELLTVNGRIKGFLHVTARDGTEGYVMKAWVKEAVFRPKDIRAVTVCTGEKVPLLTYPLLGARTAGTLERGALIRVGKSWGDYYALETKDGVRYVEKQRVGILALTGGEDRLFFRLPNVKGKPRRDGVEEIYCPGLITAEGAALRRPGEKDLPLKKGSTVYVYTAYGDWYGVSRGGTAGYIRRSDAELLMGKRLTAHLQEKDLSGGRIRRNKLLDIAFSMVERGNPFQARYNLITGAKVKSLFPLGVPYFWGGTSYRILTEKYPRYTTRTAWQSSPVFYRKGTVYLYGFDCVGFVKSVYQQAGQRISGTLTGRRDPAWCRAGTHVYCDDVHPLPTDWRKAARRMQVGDIMVIHHPGTHAMMYMGTLRDYGYTEQQLPALAKYLDYPLMLQSGENHYSYQRFQSLIASGSQMGSPAASPTDGGVGICILGVPRKDAEMTLTLHGAVSRCFDVEGCCVTMLDFNSVTDYFVWRMGNERTAWTAAPGAAEEAEGGMDLEN
ncbi:MAG: C40 family peptidase [Clostridia bacterium]|nr:C40 family peptidase [Clostridia bacterium]